MSPLLHEAAAVHLGATPVAAVYLGAHLVWTAEGDLYAAAADKFTRTIASGWGDADVGGPWTTTAGAASVSGGQGILTLAAGGASAGARLGDVRSLNAAVQVAVTFDRLPDGSGGYALIRPRITPVGTAGRRDEYRLKINITQTGVVTVWWAKAIDGVETAITAETTVPITYASGTRLNVKAAATGTSPTRLRAKVWAGGTAEPSAWFSDLVDTSATLQAAGQIGVFAAVSGGTTNVPVLAAFDDLDVTPEPTETVAAPIWRTFYADPTIAETAFGPVLGLTGKTYNIADPESGWDRIEVPTFGYVDTSNQGTPKPERLQIIGGADVVKGAWPRAYRADQRADETYRGRLRAEVHTGIPPDPNNVPAANWPLLPTGQERWLRYGVAFPPGFYFSQKTTSIPWWTGCQIKGWEGSASGMPGGSPPFSVELEGPNLRVGGRSHQMNSTGRAWDDPIDGPARPWADHNLKTARTLAANVTADSVHEFAIGVFLSPDPTKGWVQVFRLVDGEAVEEVYPRTYGPTQDIGTVGQAAATYLKTGIYRSSGWKTEGPGGTPVHHVVHLADMIVAPTLPALLAAIKSSPLVVVPPPEPMVRTLVGTREGVQEALLPDGTAPEDLAGGWQPGDLAIVFTGRASSSNTGTASGWSILRSGTNLGGVSTRLAFKELASGDTSTGVWSGGQRTYVEVWRDAVIGAHAAPASGTGTAMSYPALTLNEPTVSEVSRFGIHAAATALGAPAGTPTVRRVTAGSPRIGAFGSSGPSGHLAAATGTADISGGWQGFTVEVKTKPAA